MLKLPNIKRESEISERIYNRSVADKKVQIYLSPKPQVTRYVKYPEVNKMEFYDMKSDNTELYKVETTFLPGNTGPGEGYAFEIDTETTLKRNNNRYTSTYNPDITSDMYAHAMTLNETPIEKVSTKMFTFSRYDVKASQPNLYSKQSH
jgi:hypothetical protein